MSEWESEREIGEGEDPNPYLTSGLDPRTLFNIYLFILRLFFYTFQLL
jgi:hypothetical protein